MICLFTNRENCTVWEKTIQNRAPAYVRHELGAYYLETISAQETDRTRSTSHNPENLQLFIIPAESLTYLPKTDDRILDGIHAETSPPADARSVTIVKDFRFGSECVHHAEVTAQ